ncbi:hypothetical protein FRAHR75_870018 [Frankia sp. Hr75.2]|nr:hypothetical protein FRAHR75_870018 [Frankia sp. Hr75.2]
MRTAIPLVRLSASVHRAPVGPGPDLRSEPGLGGVAAEVNCLSHSRRRRADSLRREPRLEVAIPGKRSMTTRCDQR